MGTGKRVLAGVLALGLGVGLFALGRASVDTGAARRQGYADGVTAGHADGLREGRALQGTGSVPADARDAARAAFDAGYAAGANDVFGGYDGGWGLSSPYVIVLVPGDGGVTYRIESRTELRPGVDYYLCPGGTTVCQR